MGQRERGKSQFGTVRERERKEKEIPLKCEGGLLGQWEKELARNGEEL